MGTLLGVAETKGAIYEALSDDGIGVVNADDAFAPYFIDRLAGRRVFRFGLENDADVRAEDIAGDAERSRFRLVTPAGSAAIALPLPGRHNVMNALAASALALAAGAPLAAIVEGLENAEPVKGRQVPHRLRNGAVLIDDSYNANPGRSAPPSPRSRRRAARRGSCSATWPSSAKARRTCMPASAARPRPRAWRGCGRKARWRRRRAPRSARAAGIFPTRRRWWRRCARSCATACVAW
jgi:hypothetical protein